MKLLLIQLRKQLKTVCKMITEKYIDYYKIKI